MAYVHNEKMAANGELRSRATTARVEFQAMLDKKGWTMADFEAWAERTYPAE